MKQYDIVMLSVITLLYCFITPLTCFGEHAATPVVYTYNGTTKNGVHHIPRFQRDGIVYMTLTSSTPQPNSFTRLRFYSTEDYNNGGYSELFTQLGAEVGKKYGPFAAQAGSYSISPLYIGHEVSVWNHSVKIEYYEQLGANDREINDTKETAADLGILSDGSVIEGHIGYHGGQLVGHWDHTDYLTFKVSSSAPYYFDTYYDPVFTEIPDCQVWFNLHDGQNSYDMEAGSGTRHGPFSLSSNKQYQLRVVRNARCSDDNFGNMEIGGYYELKLSNEEQQDLIRISGLEFDSVYYCGEVPIIKVFVESLSVLPITNQRVGLKIDKYPQGSENAIYAQHIFDIFAPWETKPAIFNISNEFTSRKWHMQAGKYQVVATLHGGDNRVIDKQEGVFEIVCYDRRVMPFVLLLLTKDPKEAAPELR